ncbi:MAG TPA: hypothetical protein VGM56_19025, partial [Byssovorax sp.]
VQTYPRSSSSAIEGALDKVTAKLHVLPVGLDVLDDLVQSGDLDPSVVASMKTLDVAGAAMTWTQASSTIQYLDQGLPVFCVTVGLTTGANTGVAAPAPVCP